MQSRARLRYPICPAVCVENVCQCPAGTVLLDPDSDAQRDACVRVEECAADDAPSSDVLPAAHWLQDTWPVDAV